MNTQKIKQLIVRYENGETSREEELYLKSAFSGQEDIPFELRHYRAIFGYYNETSRQEIINPGFEEMLLHKLETGSPKTGKVRPLNRRHAYFAIAASLAILFSVYFSGMFNSTPTDTYDDPLLAYAETKKILMKVSGNLNTGMSELENIQELNAGMESLNSLSSFDDGMENFRKISILNKSQTIITSKNY